jgi:hypothetical protein
VDGLHASDLISGGVFVGTIIMWSGTLGGSDGHRPVVGGVANKDWHLCNGEVVGSVTTPDLRDRFVVGAGGNYVKGATGGATTASHNHAAIGSLAVENHPILSHSGGTQTINTGSARPVLESVNAHPALTHKVSGSTALSAPSILPPYYGLYYIMKVA